MGVNPVTWVRRRVEEETPHALEYPRTRAWLTPLATPSSFQSGLSLKSSFQAVLGDLADSRYRR